jgi:hypothetical protein
MSTEFVQRLEALSFVAAERPALRDTDIEWLFSPSHPCSNLLRMVSHALPSLAHVSNEMKASYQTLVAEGRVIKVCIVLILNLFHQVYSSGVLNRRFCRALIWMPLLKT